LLSDSSSVFGIPLSTLDFCYDAGLESSYMIVCRVTPGYDEIPLPILLRLIEFEVLLLS